MGKLNRICLMALLLSPAVPAAEPGGAPSIDPPAAQESQAEIWPKVRASLFGTRAIAADPQGVVELDAPVRAEDAATVPVAIRTRMTQSAARYIDKIYLLVDHNPSPIAAVFEFTPDSGRAEIETRIRIEQYTDIRAVAELNTGELFMATRFIKASGGCSAPAGKDAAAAAANAGQMKFRVEEPVTAGQPSLAQLMIRHPNASGLVMDQVTRLYAPAWYVREVKVSYAGRPVLTADMDFSISENPNFRFYFLPRGPGELKAEAVDTKELDFQSTVAVKPRGLAANN